MPIKSYKKSLNYQRSPRKTCGSSGVTLLKSFRFYLYACPNLKDDIIVDDDGKRWLQVTQAWLARRTGMTERNLRRILKKLQDHDFIDIRLSSGSCSMYRVKEADEIGAHTPDKTQDKTQDINIQEHVDNPHKNNPFMTSTLSEKMAAVLSAFLLPELERWAASGRSIPAEYVKEMLEKVRQDCGLEPKNPTPREDTADKNEDIETEDIPSDTPDKTQDKPRTKPRTNCPPLSYIRIDLFSPEGGEKRSNPTSLLLLEQGTPSAPALESPPQPVVGVGPLQHSAVASVPVQGEEWQEVRQKLEGSLGFGEYAAWLKKADILEDSGRLIFRLSSWFMADHVAQKFGQIIANSVGDCGFKGVNFQGPLGDVTRSRRPRVWIVPDATVLPNEQYASKLVLGMQAHLKTLRGVGDDPA